MPRPDALGIQYELECLDDCDKALHELGWLQQEEARLEALCKQKIEAIKQDFAGRMFVTIEGQQFSMSDRIADLEDKLQAWTGDNIGLLLPKGKKTRALLHGELGLRRAPLVVEIGRDDSDQKYDPTSILGWIDESVLTPSQKRGLVKTEVELHLKGAKDLLVAKKITPEELAAIGLTVRDAADEPVVKPTKLVVCAE